MDHHQTAARREVTTDAEFDSLIGTAPLGRRGFVAGSLCAGFAASVAPTGALLAQTITTPTDGLRTGEVLMRTRDDKAIPAYFAAPANRNGAPIILVVQEIFGVHEHIRDLCRRFAREGWHAMAPELFFRQGDPSKYPSMAQISQSLVPSVPDAQVMADLDAAADYAHTNGGDRSRLGITGFCWGGRITWLYAAHNPQVKAGVAWYGRLTGTPSANLPINPYDIAGKLNAPVLGLYGGQDAGIPVANVDEMKRLLAQGNENSKRSEIVVYPDAPHAFNADYRPSYRKDAADDGMKRATAWFRRFGVV
jgi:carboxymethylenebutenolidase